MTQTETQALAEWDYVETAGHRIHGQSALFEEGKSIAIVYDGKAHGPLLAAAANSYRKHCGPRAVECAEADLLGELLEACRVAVEHIEDEAVAQNLIAAIAKAEGERNERTDQ